MTTIEVWDADAGEIRTVTPSEAVAGLMRYAKQLGPGTPAAAVATKRALQVAAEHGLKIGRKVAKV